MDLATRRRLARQTLSGYESGPSATDRATALAMDQSHSAEAVILVEGVSDQIAVETLAARRGLDLGAARIVVMPIGGAHGVTKYLRRYGPCGENLRLAGLCDTGEEDVFRRGLSKAGVGTPQSRADMQQLGFHVCVDDLEEELIRAVGPAGVMAIFEAHGDSSSFTTLQRQAAWRDQPVDAQLRRFLGAGARRKLRYARLLVEAVDLNRVPGPLEAVLAV